MIFNELDEFKKEFKKLCKKYNSLEQDFLVFKDVLEVAPRWDWLPEDTIVRISNLWENIIKEIYKVRKFRCQSISKNSKNSWLRIIYSYEEKTQEVNFEQIEFIEIFHKNDRENHNKERIEKYYSN